MKLLKKLYEISSPSREEKVMCQFIKSLLKGMKVSFTEDKHGNIYATKGESDTYPCIVCHTDEVHDTREKGYKVVRYNDLMFAVNEETMEFNGIGADDKNGIWVCLKALNDFDVLKCAFFVGEEIGCVGSSLADMSFFEDCRFVLQCDRKGNKDFIINASGVDLCSSEFVDACHINEFGYEVERGMMTDVMMLKELGLSVSACNISCGYYNPHSDNEMTNIQDLLNCYGLVKSIIERCTDVYPHEPSLGYNEPQKSEKLNYNHFDWWDYELGSHKYSRSDEFDEMCEEMYSFALEMDNEFKLDDFIAYYEGFYPQLKREDYEYACQDILGYVAN
jgi:putative aminopeptidase FrvX